MAGRRIGVDLGSKPGCIGHMDQPFCIRNNGGQDQVVRKALCRGRVFADDMIAQPGKRPKRCRQCQVRREGVVDIGHPALRRVIGHLSGRAKPADPPAIDLDAPDPAEVDQVFCHVTVVCGLAACGAHGPRAGGQIGIGAVGMAGERFPEKGHAIAFHRLKPGDGGPHIRAEDLARIDQQDAVRPQPFARSVNLGDISARDAPNGAQPNLAARNPCARIPWRCCHGGMAAPLRRVCKAKRRCLPPWFQLACLRGAGHAPRRGMTLAQSAAELPKVSAQVGRGLEGIATEERIRAEAPGSSAPAQPVQVGAETARRATGWQRRSACCRGCGLQSGGQARWVRQSA